MEFLSFSLRGYNFIHLVLNFSNSLFKRKNSFNLVSFFSLPNMKCEGLIPYVCIEFSPFMETIFTFKKSAKIVSTGKFGLHCNIQHGVIPALETQLTETR